MRPKMALLFFRLAYHEMPKKLLSRAKNEDRELTKLRYYSRLPVAEPETPKAEQPNPAVSDGASDGASDVSDDAVTRHLRALAEDVIRMAVDDENAGQSDPKSSAGSSSVSSR